MIKNFDGFNFPVPFFGALIFFQGVDFKEVM